MTLDYGLVPTITRPTRITKSTATLIDNILVSQNFCTRFSSNILLDDISDHLPSILVLQDVFVTKKDRVSITSRDMRQKNVTALKQHLGSRNWTDKMTSPDYDKNVLDIHHTLMEALDHYVPERTRQVSYSALRREPWVTAGILVSTKKAKKLFQTHPSTELQTVSNR